MAVILIVDDDVDVTEAISLVLADDGYEVCAAVNEADALRLMVSRRPVLALVDYRIPGVDVTALIAALRARAAGPCRIVLSTAADAPEALAQRTGADMALPKPFPIEALLELAARAAASAASSALPGEHPPAAH